MPNGSFLLKTGGSNPSPVYNTELPRFNGWARQPPTLTRLPARGRALEHPAHTPARPLAGRSVPQLAMHQVPPFAHQVTFAPGVGGGLTVYFNSPRLPTPCRLTKLFCWWFPEAIEIHIQAALSPNDVTTDAQMSASFLILKAALPYTNPLQPIADVATLTMRSQLNFDLNLIVPAPPRNIITLRLRNNDLEPFRGYFAFHIEPL